MKRTIKRRNDMEMRTVIDQNGFVLSVEFIRRDGGSDKIVIDRQENEDEEE